MGFEAPKFDQREQFETIAEAEEQIEKMFEQGIRPLVTVKEKWVHTLRNGLEKHTSWIPGFDEVVGTMGIDPYIPEDEGRVVVKVNVDSPKQIRPRYTGPDQSFHGVVVLNGPIPPESIQILGTQRVAA